MICDIREGHYMPGNSICEKECNCAPVCARVAVGRGKIKSAEVISRVGYNKDYPIEDVAICQSIDGQINK